MTQFGFLFTCSRFLHEDRDPDEIVIRNAEIDHFVPLGHDGHRGSDNVRTLKWDVVSRVTGRSMKEYGRYIVSDEVAVKKRD